MLSGARLRLTRDEHIGALAASVVGACDAAARRGASSWRSSTFTMCADDDDDGDDYADRFNNLDGSASHRAMRHSTVMHLGCLLKSADESVSVRLLRKTRWRRRIVTMATVLAIDTPRAAKRKPLPRTVGCISRVSIAVSWKGE